MAREVQKIDGPNYQLIYRDIIQAKCPERIEELAYLLDKKSLSFFDIIYLNSQIFGEKNSQEVKIEQKYRAYNQETILKILKYKVDYCLSNVQVATHFRISRNTIYKWVKIFGLRDLK